MASTTALFTGLSGLNAHARSLDVIGNNIANANTVAYKTARPLFAPLFSRTLSAGTEPGAVSGGTNPAQVGYGVTLAGTQRDLRSGALTPTGDARDLAIEGEGFFIVDRDGQQFFTRAGSFRTTSGNELVNINGDRAQGFGVDANFNIVQGRLGTITIPLGTLTIAEATRTVRVAGNLDASGPLPTRGSLLSLAGSAGAPLDLIAGATRPPSGSNRFELDSLLVEIAAPGSASTPLFASGQTLRLSGAEKGTRILPDADLAINAQTTVADLLDFLRVALALRTGAGANPDGRTPGVALDPAAGTISLVGNTGSASDLALDSTDLLLLDASGALAATPFAIDKLAAADGESVRTTFVVYDSLGAPLTVDLTLVLQATTAQGSTWRFDVDSVDDTDGYALTSGTIDFDTAGRLRTADPVNVSLDRVGSGAASPLVFALEFAGDRGGVTALADAPSTVAIVFQNGSPPGTLQGYTIGPGGEIIGTFSNAVTRTLGQVAVGMFSNPAGLVDAGGTLFSIGANSGPLVVTTPGQLGSGTVTSGALEQSNVDLGEEFINLILVSTGYTASSRVIRTADQLIQTLLTLAQ